MCVFAGVNSLTYLHINTDAGIHLGVGDTVVMKGISAATGRTIAAITADLHKLGDLGDVAQVKNF